MRSGRKGIRRRRLTVVLGLLVVVGAAVLAGVATHADGSGNPRLGGARLTVLGDWSGAEEKRFLAVLTDFHRRTGATVQFAAATGGVPIELARLIATGRSPDVAFLPQPGLLRQYATAGRLVPLDTATAESVRRNYAHVWQDLASVDGRMYGVWFKAADKSLIWYSIGAFERLGIVPPDRLDGLIAVASRLSRHGGAAFAVAGADGWTLTDVFENLYLRTAGTVSYDRLSTHALRWTDPTVVTALRRMQQLFTQQTVAGGLRYSARVTFEQAVAQLAGRTPAAGMLIEGDFVAGIVTGETKARVGVDVDAFPFPAVHALQPAMIVGGDVAVQLRRSAAGAALMNYLSTPQAAAIWAASGGFLSPNTALDLSTYPDDRTRSFARSLLEAGEDLRFDLSDMQPPSFGGENDRGMAADLRALLLGQSPSVTAQRLETDARAAYAGAPR